MIIYSRTALATDVDGNLTKFKTVGVEQDELKTSDQLNNQYLEKEKGLWKGHKYVLNE